MKSLLRKVSNDLNSTMGFNQVRASAALCHRGLSRASHVRGERIVPVHVAGVRHRQGATRFDEPARAPAPARAQSWNGQESSSPGVDVAPQARPPSFSHRRRVDARWRWRAGCACRRRSGAYARCRDGRVLSLVRHEVPQRSRPDPGTSRGSAWTSLDRPVERNRRAGGGWRLGPRLLPPGERRRPTLPKPRRDTAGNRGTQRRRRRHAG